MKKITAFLFIVLTSQLFSQWNANTSINTPVTLASKSQQNIHAISDTKKGSIIAWDDTRNSSTNSSDIYAQRIKSNGFTKWMSGGTAICTNTLTQKSVAIADGGIDGSAIITWEDNRNGNYDIYAQKIDSSGNILWAVDGIIVCNRSTNQKNPKIISDNAGGAIVVWEDSASFYFDIYAQRINSSGTPIWTTSGVSVCVAPNEQNNPKLDIDNLGGAIITWQDKRNNIDYDIYAQRLNSLGTALWATNGIIVCNAINTQNNPRIEPDGANGAVIGWVDKRSATDYNIYAQHINSVGAVQWTSNGVLVCGATNNQSALDVKYVTGTGLFLTWKDERFGPNQIYAQLLNSSGLPQLITDGVQLSNSLKSINPNSINDGAGGTIIVWQDSTSLGWDIKSQKLNSLGALQWAVNGVNISTAVDDQINASQVTDGNGGAVYVWEDHRNGTDNDIYAHHLFYNGAAVDGINEISKKNELEILCFPNPISLKSIIKLNNNLSNQTWEITIYDAFGKVITNKAIPVNENFEINSDDYLQGVYFYFITLNDKSASSKGSFISIK